MENKKAIILLFFANSISGLAQGISMIAIPWYFNDVLQDPSLFGMAYGIITFITIFWSSFAGTLIDRYPRKNIFLCLNLAGAFLLTIVAVSGFSMGRVPIPLIIMVFATTFFIFNVHYPNLYALIQEITPSKHYSKINSYLEIQGQLTTASAGAMAAMLLTGIPEGAVTFAGITFNPPIAFEAVTLQFIFALNAATYFIAFSVLSFLHYKPVLERSVERGHVWKRIKSGFNFLTSRPLIFAFGILSHNIFVIVLVKLFFLFAMYVHNHLEEKAHIYALSDMLFAVGALFAGIFARKLFSRTNTIQAILINLMLATIIMFVYAATTLIPLVFVISFLLGMANSGTRILRITYIFNHVPNYVIGRANSVLTVINTFLRMLFIILFSIPFFAWSNNVVYAYTIFGIFAFISFALLAWIYPRLPKN